MDLNYLYERYAVSLHMAENAGCRASRMVHEKFAEGYAALIAEARLGETEAVPA